MRTCYEWGGCGLGLRSSEPTWATAQRPSPLHRQLAPKSERSFQDFPHWNLSLQASDTTHSKVSWSLTSPFSTNMAISETKGQGWRAIPTYPVKAGQRYINLNPNRHFLQQPPKRERDREAHLNYYASAYNRGRQLSHRKTKLNQIQQNDRINLN